MAQLPSLNINWDDKMSRMGPDERALLLAELRRSRRRFVQMAHDAKREAGIRKARGE